MPKTRKQPHNFSSANMWKKQKLPADVSQNDIDEVKALFEKKFSYTPLSSLPASGSSEKDNSLTVEKWIGEIPVLSEGVMPDPQLMTLKQEMNATKDQLSSKDIEIWHTHTKDCNLAGTVMSYVRSLDVEMVTQAWVKFYEIMTSHKIVPNQDFLSIHLCEAPGAFVTALNHYLQRTKNRCMWDWRATTLNPYYEGNSMDETVADDRLIRLTYIQWFFGADGTGDITAKNHVKDLCQLVRTVEEDQEMPVLLVTADGSRDCQINPAEQESILSRLHYCEMLAMCLLLNKGGNFVLKVFTMFEPAAVTLVFLLSVMFSEVHVMKPATSKSGNSEMYLVCLSYKKNIQEETVWKLMDLIVYSGSNGVLNLAQDIPAAFMEEHRRCCQNFSKWQLETIRKNLQMFENMSATDHRCLESKQELTRQEYLKRTHLGPSSYVRKVGIHPKDRPVFHILSYSSQPRHIHQYKTWNHKNQKGTFHLRQNVDSLPWQERVLLIDPKEEIMPPRTLQCKTSLAGSYIEEVKEVERGQPITSINNSRLCGEGLLKDFNIMLHNSDFATRRQERHARHGVWLGKMLSSVFIPSSTSSAASRSKPEPLYWITDGDETESVIYKSFILHHKDQVQFVQVSQDELAQIGNSNSASPQVFCNMTAFCDNNFRPFCDSLYEELTIKRKFLQRLVKILKHLKNGSRLILLTSTFLSRMMAGLLYILARSFQWTSLHSEPNLWLHQLLVLEDYREMAPELLQHLEDICQQLEDEESMGESSNCVMEVANFCFIINDRKFNQFVSGWNNFTLAGFVNLMLRPYQQMRAEKEAQEVVERDEEETQDAEEAEEEMAANSSAS